jgi:two-component system, cell cycle response regulator DivK
MSHRILVVEDNAANLELLQEWLSSEGFQVQAATTLDEAFEVCKVEPPDAILLDVQLGPQDGLALVTWVRRDLMLRAIPVIAVTAHAMLTDHERVMRAGCSACVSKPVDFRQLREQLDHWLREPTRTA